MLARIVRGVRKHGPVGSARAAWDLAIVIPRERRRRPSLKPPLRDLVRATASIECTAEGLLRRFGIDVTEDLAAAADSCVAELERRTASLELSFPERHAVERESARFLYLLVRTIRPGLMLETGVANGASTFMILTAMDQNASGVLVSTDVTGEVASLLSAEERVSDRWDLRVIEPGGFGAVLDSLGPLDVFLHDSDHAYANVLAEVSEAWLRVRPGGFVLADDGELSFAFLDAVDGRASEVLGLFDRRKLLLATRRG